MNLRKETDNAVSPVVGVMLMIIITVVIAAVIVAFSTGLTGDESGTAPVAMIDIGDITLEYKNAGYAIDYVEFIHKGGDPLLLDNVEITMVGNLQIITNRYTYESFYKNSLDDVKYPSITVFGKSGSGITVGPGDIIRITTSSHANQAYYEYEEVTWSLHDIRTDSVIAKGVFTVPPHEES